MQRLATSAVGAAETSATPKAAATTAAADIAIYPIREWLIRLVQEILVLYPSALVFLQLTQERALSRGPAKSGRYAPHNVRIQERLGAILVPHIRDAETERRNGLRATGMPRVACIGAPPQTKL